MARKETRRRRGGAAPTRESVRASVKLDAAAYARVCAAAAVAGVTKSNFMAAAIVEACRGFSIVDRRKGLHVVYGDDEPGPASLAGPGDPRAESA